MAIIDPLTNFMSGNRKKTSKMLTDALAKQKQGLIEPMQEGGVAGYQEGGMVDRAVDWTRRNVIQPAGQAAHDALMSVPATIPQRAPIQAPQMGTGYLNQTANATEQHKRDLVAAGGGYAEGGMVDPLIRYTTPAVEQGLAKYKYAVRPLVQNTISKANAIRGLLPAPGAIEDAILTGGEKVAAPVAEGVASKVGLGRLAALAGGPVGAGAYTAYKTLESQPLNDIDEVAAIKASGKPPVAQVASPIRTPIVTPPVQRGQDSLVEPPIPVETPQDQSQGSLSSGGKNIAYENIGVKGRDPFLDSGGSSSIHVQAPGETDKFTRLPHTGEAGYSFNPDSNSYEKTEPMVTVGRPNGLQVMMKESEALAKGMLSPQQLEAYNKNKALTAQTDIASQEAKSKMDVEAATAEEKRAKAGVEKADADFAAKHGFKMGKGDAASEAANASLTPEAIKMYAQQGVDEGHLPVGVGGYGKVGQAVRNAISNEMAAIAKSQGLDNVNMAVNRIKNRSDQTAINQAQKILSMTKGYEDTVNNYIPVLKQQRAELNLSKFKKFADFEYAASKDFFGDAKAQQLYGTLYETLVDYSKVVGGNFGASGLTDAARKEGDKLLAASNDPKTFEAVLNNFQNLMNLRTKALTKVPQDIVSRYGNKGGAATQPETQQAAPQAAQPPQAQPKTYKVGNYTVVEH